MVFANFFSMLKSLFIKNYILINQLDLDFNQGFHVFTGETGAGKSIIVGALSLILGNRADYSVIRDKQLKCEISALFDIANNIDAQNWLKNLEIEHSFEIEIRRIISSDGRSKAWINNRPCTNASLKQLGELFVQIHGQHDQIKLNNSLYQLHVIDEAGNFDTYLKDVESLFLQIKETNKKLKEIELAGALNKSESQLLQYQHEELSQLNLTETEIDELHKQQTALTSSVNNLKNIENSLALLSGNHSNVNQSIAQINTYLQEIKGINLTDVLAMLDEVSINLNEIEAEIQSHHANVEVNPEKLQRIEQRLDTLYSTARKHQVNADNLYQHYLQLSEKLELNDSQKQQRQDLLDNKNKLEEEYAHKSKELFKLRQASAQKFQQKVTQTIQQLGLENAQFMVNITHNTDLPLSKNGQDSCDFEVIMNPGQTAQKMAKTASGGELSRIALAIEICKKQENQSSSFVFDEVDAGIGGAVAETVGRLMRQLSERQQVFAVTHLPHVAGLAHHHYLVRKTEVDGLTESSVTKLEKQNRIEELARMSGGSKITETTLKQAQDFMLE